MGEPLVDLVREVGDDGYALRWDRRIEWRDVVISRGEYVVESEVRRGHLLLSDLHSSLIVFVTRMPFTVNPD